MRICKMRWWCVVSLRESSFAFGRIYTTEGQAFHSVLCRKRAARFFCTLRRYGNPALPRAIVMAPSSSQYVGNPHPHSPLFVPLTRLPCAACSACVCSLSPAPYLLRTVLWEASERPRPQTCVCAWVDSANAS